MAHWCFSALLISNNVSRGHRPIIRTQLFTASVACIVRFGCLSDHIRKIWRLIRLIKCSCESVIFYLLLAIGQIRTSYRWVLEWLLRFPQPTLFTLSLHRIHRLILYIKVRSIAKLLHITCISINVFGKIKLLFFLLNLNLLLRLLFILALQLWVCWIFFLCLFFGLAQLVEPKLIYYGLAFHIFLFYCKIACFSLLIYRGCFFIKIAIVAHIQPFFPHQCVNKRFSL